MSVMLLWRLAPAGSETRLAKNSKTSFEERNIQTGPWGSDSLLLPCADPRDVLALPPPPLAAERFFVHVKTSEKKWGGERRERCDPNPLRNTPPPGSANQDSSAVNRHMLHHVTRNPQQIHKTRRAAQRDVNWRCEHQVSGLFPFDVSLLYSQRPAREQNCWRTDVAEVKRFQKPNELDEYKYTLQSI